MLEFQAIEESCRVLSSTIGDKEAELLAILQRIEPRDVALDEIHKSQDCLRNIKIEQKNFVGGVESMATLMPLNLPLYSLVLFGIMPSYLAEEVTIKVPAILNSIFSEIATLLDLEKSHRNVHLYQGSRDDFAGALIPNVDVTLFTGKIENANKLRNTIRKDGMFLFNGRGVNPVVVGPGADVEIAAKKSVDVKIFNSGQDCAAADCILVHRSVSSDFIAAAAECLARIKVGDFADPDVRVGPLFENRQLLVAAEHLVKFSDQIVFGGNINFKDRIMQPTMVFVPGFESVNYKEFFSPLLHVVEYRDEADLQAYFEAQQYRYNAMYVTTFGTSSYVSSGQSHSIVLAGKTIHEHERGNFEYGGFSFGASFVQMGRTSVAQPILVSREIASLLNNRRTSTRQAEP